MGTDPHRPHRSYRVLTATFNLAGWVLAHRIRGRAPPLSDLLVLGVATQQIARTVAIDRVTRPLREPFVDEPEPGREEPKPEGFRRALGELLTCQYCLSPWTALALTGAYAVLPRTTRAFAGILCVAAASDFLNRAYARLQPPQLDRPEDDPRRLLPRAAS